MPQREIKKYVDYLNTLRLKAKSDSFWIQMKEVNDHEINDFLETLSSLEHKGLLKYSIKNRNLPADPTGLIWTLQQTINIDLLQGFMKYIQSNDTSVISYLYKYGTLKIYVDQDEVGEINFNPELSSHYEYAFMHPGEKVTNDSIQATLSHKPMNERFNRHEYYSRVLKHFIIASHKTYVVVENNLEVDQGIAMTIRNAFIQKSSD